MQMSQSMRMEQRQLLTPRMIQSMEILQMPLLALEERIDQELQANPTLEVKPDRAADADEGYDTPPDRDRNDRDAAGDADPTLADNRALDTTDGSAEFDRLARISDYLDNEEFSTNGSGFRVGGQAGGFSGGSYDGERDRKLDAMANSPCRATTLAEHLMAQWPFVECPPDIKAAGIAVIAYLDDEGYLRTPIEEVCEGHKSKPCVEHAEAALKLIQRHCEPAGVGARDLRECLLIQLDHCERDAELAEGHDFPLERAIVRDHLKDLEMNRYPQMGKKLGRPIADLQAAVKRLARLHPHPGKQLGRDDAPPITPDAVITYVEEEDRYAIEMTNDPAPNLYIRGMYKKMMKDRAQDKKTREFLTNNVRNARWLIESIEQRRGTIERVVRAVVDAQREFFEKGPEHLKPLPMIHVADQLGIHVATVSRAVSEKWIQTPRGVFPLRRFFSQGTTSDDGEDMSWDAVKEKLRAVIADEDKNAPLNDDELVVKMKEQGIDLARRTVAKYRKLLNIPTARQRKAF